MKLRIERAEVFGVAMPLIGTFTSAGISKQATKCVVVRLTASDGTVGISSIEPSAAAKSPGTAAEILVTLRDRVAAAVVGQDPTNINRLIELLDGLAPTQPGAGAAVEMACVELASRIQGVPLYTYLGGATQTDVLFNGWIGMLPPEEAAAEARKWLQAGFRSAKIKVGSGVEADRDRIAAVRATVGSAMKLRIDANLQYDADTSLKLCRLVKQFDLQLFEQPAHLRDLEGMARVRREGGIPVMADESVSDHASLIAVIKADAADFVKFGIKQAGGILRASRMLATAEAAGIPVVIGHGFGLDPGTLAEIMLAASSRNVLPGLECVGPLKVKDTVTTTRLDISSGSLQLPAGPGLGISLDENKLEQYRLS
ncbi:MAG TPA: enolase C-terminal domain-like protein [Burkholderiales bacterium]|nr:enolase C-terminal domain-like protein [Burkholderiales bacterium]